jgi:acyl-CoA synthetase (NDP forming)
LNSVDRPRGLEAVFGPRRVAVVGASDHPGSIGATIWRNLSEFPGEIIPVTLSSSVVSGRRAYSSLGQIEGDVDLAIVVVPANQVIKIVREAVSRGVPALVIVSGGFAEIGPAGARLQAELLATARAGGVRVVGPNSFGIQNCDLGLNASIAPGSTRGAGGITLVTQSGAYGMAIHSLGIDEGARFAKVYAAGNKADISDAELLRYLRQDQDSRVLCFYLESMAGGREFVTEARCTTPTKPVVVTKTGRSEAGARAARFHTAALAGHHGVASGAFAQAGIIETRSGLEMLDVARALAAKPWPLGPRVAIVTNSGGTGVELADLLCGEGMEVPQLSVPLQQALRQRLPTLGSAVNPVDMTPVWHRYATMYPEIIDLLARSSEVDVVVAVLLHRAALDERVIAAVREAALRLRADSIGVPLYVCWVAPREARPHATLLQAAGVPCFEWPERTARAIALAARYARARQWVRPQATPPPRPAAIPRLPPGLLPPLDSTSLLRTAGIPLARSVLCNTIEEALDAATAVGFPAVAKIIHAEVLHKSDIGGVRKGLANLAMVNEACAELFRIVPGAQVMIQPQIDGLEVIVGGLRDAEFGPSVMVGLGGVLVEAIHDIAFATAPLGAEEALALLRRLRGFPAFARPIGGRSADLASLAALIRAVGDLVAAVPEVATVDLNPLLVSSQGCLAVDWRIEIRNRPH